MELNRPENLDRAIWPCGHHPILFFFFFTKLLRPLLRAERRLGAVGRPVGAVHGRPGRAMVGVCGRGVWEGDGWTYARVGEMERASGF